MLLLALMLLADPRARVVDVEGGAIAQVQAGRAPRTPGEEPVPSVATILTPNGRLLVRNRWNTSAFTLEYMPRLLFRWPNLTGLRRPLLLNQVLVGWAVAMSQRWDMSVNGRADVGEIDYTASQIVFGDMQGALPEAEVIQFVQANGGVTFQGQLSQRHTLGIAPTVSYSAPLREQPDASDPNVAITSILPTTLNTSLGLSHGYVATPRDTITTTVSGGYVDFSERGAQATGTAELAWRRRITRRLDGTLAGGAFVAQPVREPNAGLDFDQRSPILPTGRALLLGRVYNRARLRVTVDAQVASLAYYDTISGQIVPTAGTNVGVTAFLPPRWTMGVRGSFYTVTTREPRVFGDDMDAVNIADTIVTAQTPVSYLIDDNLMIEFGTLFSARGPHVRAPGFRMQQLAAWAYVAFRFQFSTTRNPRTPGGGGDTVTGGVVQ
jgi:hypothetical protein